MMRREYSVDLYRILLMYGICLLHTITQGGHQLRGLDNALLSCVDGFVFISGYFSMTVEWRKIIRLIFTAIFCLGVSSIVGVALFDFSSQEVMSFFVRRLNEYWFLWAYIVLMLLSPLLDVRLKKGIGLLICVYVWSYSTQIPVVRNLIPKPMGFGAYGFLTLSAAYLVGRLYAKSEQLFQNKIPRSFLVITLILLFAANWLGFGHYHSPTAIAFVLVSFALIKGVNLRCGVARVVKIITPSMFAVYLLHTNIYGFRCISALEDWLLGLIKMPTYIMYVITSIVIFVGCIILDIPRRLIIRKFQDFACELKRLEGET